MIKHNLRRKLTIFQFEKLLAEGWKKSATVNNKISAFKATGIVPFNSTVIPDDTYLTEISSIVDILDAVAVENNQNLNVPVVSANVDSVRRRSKQLAEILTTETTIGKQKEKAARKTSC